MKASVLILALVPAIYAAPALSDHDNSDQAGSVENNPNPNDLETEEHNTITYSIDPETGEKIPDVPDHSEDDSDQLRLSLFLEKMANLTSNLLATTDLLAQRSGKTLLDVVQFPPSMAPLWINTKREEHKTTWQEVTTATLDGIDVAIKEMEDLGGAVTGQELSQIASTVGSIL